MKSNHANAVREAQSRESIVLFLEGEGRFGLYDQIFDRSNYAPVSRYLKGELPLVMPSPDWTDFFVQKGGKFDSCGVWGIHPNTGVRLEGLEIPPEFAGKMFALLGRADYDFSYVAEVYNEGFDPQSRAEFHACVRGIQRQKIAQASWAKEKSTLRLGWMKDEEFLLHILSTSQRICEGTTYFSFNKIYMREDFETLLNNEKCLQNPVFANWVAKRPSEKEMSRRQQNKRKPSNRITLKKLPSHLVATAIRNDLNEYRDQFRNFSNVPTSVGNLYDVGNNILMSFSGYWGLPLECQKAKNFTGRKIREDLAVVKIAGVWFVWNPENGFQSHMENPSLKEAVRLWENRSRRGEPRSLSLNDVRNDMSGTAGFCLAGTKSFLQDKMPFVYRLVSRYTSWDEIPADILSTKWEVDWGIFQGYPVP